MTRLWTQSEIEIDASLNQRLALLGRAISVFFENKPVVFHDAAGGFAPVVDDPARVHIHLHGVPRTTGNRRHAPRALDHLPGYFGPAMARLAACSSRALTTTATAFMAAAGERLLQEARLESGAHNLFLLVRPARQHETTLDPRLTANLLVHLLLVRRSGAATRQRPNGLAQHVCRHESAPAEIGGATLAEIAQQLELDLSPLEAFSRQLRDRQTIQGILDNTDPRQAIERELNDLRRHLRMEEDRIQSRQAEMTELRQQRERARSAGDQAQRREQMRAELAAIWQLPQVRAVELTSTRVPMLRIELCPMVLARGADRRATGTALLSPTILKLPMPSIAHDQRVEVEDIFESGVPGAHVRGSPCLGNLQENLQTCLNDGQLAIATQLLIGFLQTFDADDTWGRVGTIWPGFDDAALEISDGNAVRLRLPDAAPAASPDAPHAPDTHDAG